MSGFMSNSTALMVFIADGAKFNERSLRQHVFTPSIDEEGKRIGWVGLGDPLDTDFSFGLEQDHLAAFSLRVDTRKASSAAVNIQLAEALREKAAAGEKVKGKVKKDLKEAITATLTSKAPFIPTLIDCLWDLDKGRLLVSTASAKALLPFMGLFSQTFGVEPEPVSPKGDMTELFAEICRNEQYECCGFVLSPFGSASLATPGQTEDKALVAVQNNINAVALALDEGLKIQKVRLMAASQTSPDFQLDFMLDSALAVSGLKLPKAEKGAEDDAEFLLKADACSSAADIVEALASA